MNHTSITHRDPARAVSTHAGHKILNKLGLFALFIYLGLSAVYAQEICNNGIDDDGDGFVDFLDEDCLGIEADNGCELKKGDSLPAIMRIVKLVDGSYRAVGYTNISRINTSSNFDFFIQAFDAGLNVLGSANYHGVANHSITCWEITPLSDGGYAVVSGFMDNATSGVSLIQKAFVSKYNAANVLQWTRRIASGNGITRIYDIQESSPGVITVVGPTNATNSGKESALLYNINASTGAFISSLISNFSSGVANQLVALKRARANTDFIQWSQTGTADQVLSRINAAGTTQWSINFGNNGLTTREYASIGNSLINDNDTSWAVGRGQSQSVGGFDATLVKVAPNGTVLLDNNYGTTATTEAFEAIVKINSNKFFAVGTTQIGGTSRAMAVMLDRLGNVVWSKYFANTSSFTDAVKISPNRILLTGYNGLTINVDSNGGMVSGSCFFGTDFTITKTARTVRGTMSHTVGSVTSISTEAPATKQVAYTMTCCQEIPGNGIDDDYDNLIDCADPDLRDSTSCALGAPFSCINEELILSLVSGDTTYFRSTKTDTINLKPLFSFKFSNVSGSQYTINAIALNPTTNYIHGMIRGTNIMVKIAKNGTFNSSIVSGLPNPVNPSTEGFGSGTMNAAGDTFLISNLTTVYRINPNANPPYLYDSIVISPNIITDLIQHPTTKEYYAARISSPVGIVKVSFPSGTVTLVGGGISNLAAGSMAYSPITDRFLLYGTRSGSNQNTLYRYNYLTNALDSLGTSLSVLQSDGTGFYGNCCPLTLTPAPTVTPVNDNSCLVDTASIRFKATGMQAAISYQVRYQKDGGAYTAYTAYTSASDGFIKIPNLGGGSYDSIQVRTADTNCSIKIKGPWVIAAATIPAPSSSPSSTNPTVCAASDGTMTISGLTAAATYTVSWTASGGASSSTGTVFTANGGGSIVVSSLAKGTYSNIIVTSNTSGCAAIGIGPVTLTGPTPTGTPIINCK